ncbi:hypothetical protein Slin14017_G021100 [Septoria linicola]|nr:hypothetical protein Slin14017_G021100 [Septoria linicola]
MNQLIEPGWIADDPSNHVIFNKLVSFLDSVSADPTNASQLVASTTDALSSTGTSQPSVEQYRSESRFLFAILLTIVQQLEPIAAEQDYLIKLVLSLRESPVPESVSRTIDPCAMDSNDMNRDLDNFINVWSSIGIDAPFHPSLESRGGHVELDKVRPPWRQDPGYYLSAESWASLSAFLARLHVAARDLLKLDLRGLFAMIEALEQPLSPAELEDAIPPAAYWIIYAGKELKHNNFPYAFYESDNGTKRLP